MTIAAASTGIDVASADDQDQRDRARGDQHRALHAPLGRRVQGTCHLQERDQRELRPDADQQQQERVDRTCGRD
jgi:hypothetical protein